MAQPHKGLRTLVNLHLPQAVLQLVEKDIDRLQASSMSQYLADLASCAYGRPDLARELNQRGEQLKLPPASSAAVATRPGRAVRPEDDKPNVAVRLPKPIVQLVDKDAANHHVSRRRFLEDLYCIAYGRRDLARELRRGEEQLRLAIDAPRKNSAA
jgi:hypothetical protein